MNEQPHIANMPAFPLTTDAICHDNRAFDMQGMTLRQYFAGKAMQAIFADEWTGGDYSDAASRSVKMADALLNELIKEPSK